MQYKLKITLKEKIEALAEGKMRLTNIPKEGKNALTGEEILSCYKEQYGIAKNFGFLKDDAIVNALFLKKPE